ncbi:MAG: hypothetical protein WKF77_09775 [Planctomycetaceae bacterium]
MAYTYDDSSNRINKTLTVPGQTAVVENYVYDGDQLVAVINATGAIQHEYFDGSSLDQVFADQTVLSGVLWPLEDRTGAARDVISTAGVVLDHRKIDSFGKIASQTGPVQSRISDQPLRNELPATPQRGIPTGRALHCSPAKCQTFSPSFTRPTQLCYCQPAGSKWQAANSRV